ncbi:5-(carboxyamino)imidazole ribonucleotide mutase [Candidatus Kaiserbacteria bacterium]|nr:5-(carboxyamino)imidazole ribonucleotide mutase [Candidatus Kaiserbacteria bacterium]
MATPLVRIVMGSDSDLPVMKDAAAVLADFGIAYHMTVLSAHRTPARLIGYVQEGEASGTKVFIAAAGGAAHLAGVVAAHTTLPVIGVPILGKSTDGLDSLLSTVQMPPGVPVATVAINGAKNAGILAAQIIGATDPEVRKKIAKHKEKIAKDVLAKAQKLEEIGYEEYLKKHE